MLSFFVAALLFLPVAVQISRRFPAAERTAVLASYPAHLVAGVLQFVIVRYYYEGGDMLAYHRHAETLGRLVELDPGSYLPDVVALALRQDPPSLRMGPFVFFGGTSTGSMIGVATLLHLVSQGSLLGSCAIIACGSWLSKTALYAACRMTLPQSNHTTALYSCLWTPTALFWSNGLLKEAVAMIGLGPLVLGYIVLLVGPNRIRGALLLATGGTLVYATKPYILPAVLTALAAGTTVAHMTSKGREIRLSRAMFAAGVGTIALLALSAAMPEYSLSNITEEVANLQTVGTRVSGGSNYALANAGEASLAAQIALAPIGLFTTIFRPSLLDATNIFLALSALENTVITVLALRVLRRPRSSLRTILSNASLTTCAIFTLGFGTAVGLASTNLGTLSRYRAPLIPFLLVLLTTLAAHQRSRAPLPNRPRLSP